MSYIWLKYRHKFNSRDHDWEYTEVPIPDKCKSSYAKKKFVDEEVIPNMMSQFEMLGGYRGMDYNIVKQPPMEVIEKKLKRLSIELDYLEKMQKRWEEIKNQL